MARTLLFDACVLYPAPLRDLLMRLALTGLFQARWSAEIHDEWIRNVLANRPDLTLKSLERCRDLMDQHVPDCLVTGFEWLIPTLTLPDRDDRHVLAAAIHSGAGAIITFNLSDFPGEVLALYAIEAIPPDEFVLGLWDASPEAVLDAARRQRVALKRPPKGVTESLDTLEQCRLPGTVSKLRDHQGEL